MEIVISNTARDAYNFVDWMKGKGFKASLGAATLFEGVDARQSDVAGSAIRILWKWYGDEMGQD